MKTLRIFISSPGDVTKERERAREVVESLRRRFSRHFMLQPVLWEDLPLQSDMSFQRGIDAVLSEKGVDIAIFILWSRLGSPLGHAIPRPDGTPYRSGTEREFDLIMQARAKSLETEGTARPAILVYTRRDDASFEEALRGTSTEEKEELVEQKKRVESFLAETFRDTETGVNIGAYFPFDRPVTFSQRLRTHLQSLLDEMAGESNEVIWDIDKQGPPFLGLEAFQPQHSAVFFGREEEILEARHALKEQAREGCAFLLLSGASGSGKSSLARAGILPAIVELEVDEQVAAWSSLVLTPSQLGPDPIASLVAHLADEPHLPSLGESSSSLQDLVAGLKKDPDLTFNLRLKEAFAKSSTKHGGSVRLLLVLDQLEEFYTTSALSTDDRAAFFAVIETFARSGSVWVLATVRSDFYEQIQNEPVLVRMKSGHGQLDVLPPGPDALARLIEEPARLAGLSFERRDDQILSSRIIKDAASHAELLPLVEFVLRELYERRSDNHQLTFAAYEDLGGVEGALANRAEAAFRSLSGASQESLSSVLQSLITLGNEADVASTNSRGERLVRQRAPISIFMGKTAARDFVDTFIADRLFTTDRDADSGESTVSVAHESLLRVWPRAVQWAEQNRDFLRTRARIAARMKEGSPLLEGDPLLEGARQHLTNDPEGFSTDQRRYIAESHQNFENSLSRRRRLRRNVLAGLSTLLIIAVIGTIWAFFERAASVNSKEEAAVATTLASKRAADFEAANTERLQELHEASMADYATAVRRFEKDDRWHEGVAHLVRALKREPDNSLAALRLYSTLAMNAPEKQNWPRQVVPHNYLVYRSQFSPDGKLVLTEHADSTCHLWDVETGNKMGTPMKGNHAQFSKDSTKVLTESFDVTIIWDLSSGKQIGEPIEGTAPRFSFDGKLIVTEIGNGLVIWDAASREVIGEIVSPDGRFDFFRFSQDSKKLFTVGSDQVLRLWDPHNAEELEELMQLVEGNHFQELSPDGTRILTSSSGGFLKTWDAYTGRPPVASMPHDGNIIQCASFSPDGARIVSVSLLDRKVRIWDAASGKLLGSPIVHNAKVESAEFSPDGLFIITASGLYTAMWDAPTGMVPGEPLRHETDIIQAKFSPDGRRILTADNEGTVKVWDASTNEALGEPMSHGDSVFHTEFSLDGSHILTASNNTVLVWNAEKAESLGDPMRHEAEIESARFSPDGKRILTAGSDGSAKVWDANTGKVVGKAIHVAGGIYTAEFSPDGTQIVTGGYDGTARLWDEATKEPSGEPMVHENFVTIAKFSPDGMKIATASLDGNARFWDATTGRPLAESMHHSGQIYGLEFSPDGTRVLTASADKNAQLWDVATGKAAAAPMRHMDEVNSARFSSDGKYIVTASSNGNVRVWDSVNCDAIGEPLRHNHDYPLDGGADFSPDGTRIVTLGSDDTARVWDAPTVASPKGLVPEWAMRWATAVSGFEFSEKGELGVISHEERQKIFEDMPSGDDAWSNLARWLVLPSDKRTLTPDSRFTLRQIAEQERDFGSKESLKASLRYDPTLPLSRLMLAGALLMEDLDRDPSFTDPLLSQRVAFLRRFDLDRLPKDPQLWIRAASILAGQVDWEVEGTAAQDAFDEAFSTARQLAEADPDNIEAQISLLSLYEWMVPLAREQQLYSEAIALMSEVIKVRKRLPPDTSELTGAYLDLSWYQLLAQDFKGAEIAAREGLPFDENDISLLCNLAHALLFQGKYAEAEAIYLKHKDDKIGIALQAWPAVITDDFKQLREVGLDHPDMKKIEALLSISPRTSTPN